MALQGLLGGAEFLWNSLPKSTFLSSSLTGELETFFHFSWILIWFIAAAYILLCMNVLSAAAVMSP